MGSKSKRIKKDENNEIHSLLEKLTHSGRDSLNVEQLKVIKASCSSSEKNVEIVYNEIIKLLGKKHSEVRLSTVQLCDELFKSNNTFRALLIKNMQTFLKYTFDEELPPPKAAAKKLLKYLIVCFDDWYKQFGGTAYKLQAAYKYLKKVKNVDFEIKEIVDPKKRKEELEKELNNLLLNKQLLKKMNSEMEDLKSEIEMTITSLETCFDLLLPSPEEFSTNPSNSARANDCDDDLEMRLYGVIDPRHTVEIQFDKSEKIEIRENEENSAIISAAKDAYTLINNRFFPKTKAWLELLNKGLPDKSENGMALIKQAQLQNVKLNQLVTKYNMLKILPKLDNIEEVSSDSDLEEVVLPRPEKASRQKEEIGFLSDLLVESKANQEMSPQKTQNTGEDNLNNTEKESSVDMSERKKKLLEVAPKLPYDIDLYHWEDEHLPTPTVLAVNSEGARFWSAGASEEILELPIPGGSSALRTRVIEFSGKFEPVERSCRVPLPSGNLCPRKDRIKCPFHGFIVDRDDKGNIVNEEDKIKVASIPRKPVTPDWQDPKLLAEIKSATGVDLKMPEKGKRKKKVKHPGLTDLNAAKKTPKARISKKIFNKASVRRVAAVMNNLEHKKHRDKFGDQFNYVHDTS